MVKNFVGEDWRKKMTRRLRVRDVHSDALFNVWEEACIGNAELVWSYEYWKLDPTGPIKKYARRQQNKKTEIKKPNEKQKKKKKIKKTTKKEL
jgi:hypothetical protein